MKVSLDFVWIGILTTGGNIFHGIQVCPHTATPRGILHYYALILMSSYLWCKDGSLTIFKGHSLINSHPQTTAETAFRCSIFKLVFSLDTSLYHLDILWCFINYVESVVRCKAHTINWSLNGWSLNSITVWGLNSSHSVAAPLELSDRFHRLPQKKTCRHLEKKCHQMSLKSSINKCFCDR